MDKIFVPLLLGTNRKDRQSENVANWLIHKMQERADIETTLFDVKNFQFPTDNYGTEIGHLFPDWQNAMQTADGLVIVTPEYNHAYPGILKSALDVLLKEYIHKAVGLVGVSSGPWGGCRVIQAMVPMVRELGLVATFTDLNFPSVEKIFDANGEMIDAPSYEKRTTAFLDELVWMSQALRWGRKTLL